MNCNSPLTVTLHLAGPLLRIAFAAIHKPCQGNFGKFQESGESRFGSSEKDRGSINLFGITREES